MQSADSHPFCSGANFRVPNIRNISLMKIWRCCFLRTRPSHFWRLWLCQDLALQDAKRLSIILHKRPSQLSQVSMTRDDLRQVCETGWKLPEVSRSTDENDKFSRLLWLYSKWRPARLQPTSCSTSMAQRDAKGTFWEHHEAWSSRILLQHLKSIRYQFV